MAKTAAERNAEFRDRMKKKGFKRIFVWVKPENEAAIRAYVKRKNG